MYNQILLNGTPSRDLRDLPSDVSARIHPFANQPIWENLPDDVVLDVRVSNATAKTWPTIETQYLPTLPPSAISPAGSDGEDSPVPQTHQTAAALVDLYTSNYTRGLTQADAASLKEDARTKLEQTTSGAGRVSLRPESDTEASSETNATVEVDGAAVHLYIPQRLYVAIRHRSNDRSPDDGAEDGRLLLAVEVQRVVHYSAIERLDVSVEDEAISRETGWTKETPAPPPRVVKAFEDAVIGSRPMYDPGRLLTKENRMQILTVFAILTFFLIIALVMIAMLR